jgi:hypothetical protein
MPKRGALQARVVVGETPAHDAQQARVTANPTLQAERHRAEELDLTCTNVPRFAAWSPKSTALLPAILTPDLEKMGRS